MTESDLEKMEDAVFSLIMQEVAAEEGRRAIEENERLKADPSFIVPEATRRRCLDIINKHFGNYLQEANCI